MKNCFKDWSQSTYWVILYHQQFFLYKFYYFKKIFLEYHQCQFGSKSGWTFFFEPDLAPNCLQRLASDEIRGLKQGKLLLLQKVIDYLLYDDIIQYSNTDLLYSRWINSVIYLLINHCTD